MVFDWDASKYAAISDLQAEAGHLLVNILQPQSHEKVLDLGCGIGNLTSALASRCKEGFVVGIDASASMISRAQESAKDFPNIEFRVLDATAIRFQREFDAVFSNSTLHWIPEAEKVLTAIMNALIPGGRIGLQFPLLNERHPLIAYSRRTIDSLGLEGYYLRWRFPWFVITAPAYTALLSLVGFQNVTVKTIHTSFRFKTASLAYDFLEAVGLGLYLTPLEQAQRNLFTRRVVHELEQSETNEGIVLYFERILAVASAPIGDMKI